jgi:hypothetical protein
LTACSRAEVFVARGKFLIATLCAVAILSFMRAVYSWGLVCLFMAGPLSLQAAPAPTTVTNGVEEAVPPAVPTDGVRPEDVMIDDDAIGDVWETISPADAIGITDETADVLPAVTSALTSAELLREKELLKAPRPESPDAKRVRTRRWRPKVPIQTLFYLALAVVVVAVLLLKARG